MTPGSWTPVYGAVVAGHIAPLVLRRMETRQCREAWTDAAAFEGNPQFVQNGMEHALHNSPRRRDNEVWRTSYTLQSTGCWMTIIDFEERRNSPDLHDYKEVYRFALADLDPNTIKSKKSDQSGYVEVETHDGRPLIRIFGDGKEQNPGWGLCLWFYNNDGAARFVKAFQHAVILCGGKPSLY